MVSIFWYVLAAAGEIAGCFCVWAWLREGKSAWLLAPGAVALAVFALSLTRIETGHAGRAFAAYGGVYIAASLLWLRLYDGVRLTRWDAGGALLCLLGGVTILVGATAASPK